MSLLIYKFSSIRIKRSKGLNDLKIDFFNHCCDSHNACLNAQCCTDTCQELRQICDMKFELCMINECFTRRSEIAECTEVANMIVSKTLTLGACIMNNSTVNRKKYAFVKCVFRLRSTYKAYTSLK